MKKHVDYIPWCVGHYNTSYLKEIIVGLRKAIKAGKDTYTHQEPTGALEFRDLHEYKNVRLGSYVKENGKSYAQLWMIYKNKLIQGETP